MPSWWEPIGSTFLECEGVFVSLSTLEASGAGRKLVPSLGLSSPHQRQRTLMAAIRPLETEPAPPTNILQNASKRIWDANSKR